MRLYRAVGRLPGAKTYTGKFFIISFIGTHIPLLSGLGYLFVTSGLPWAEVWPFLVVLVVATVAGTVVTLAGLYGLLAPVRAASGGIRAYLGERRVPALPTTFSDEGGRLMADVQEGITRLDAAIDAAERQRDAAREEAKQKFEILSRMSHELRTPLNAIIGFAEMLQSEILGPLGSSKYRNYAESIAHSGAGLSNIVQGLLEFSGVEAGSFADDDFEVTDLGEALRSACALQRVYADRAGVDMALRAGACPSIRSNKRALKQMLLHLVAGAVTATQRGHKASVALGTDGSAAVVTVIAGNGPFRSDDLPGSLAGLLKRPETREFSRGSMNSVSSLGFSLLVVATVGRLSSAELELSETPDGYKRIRLRFRDTVPQQSLGARPQARRDALAA